MQATIYPLFSTPIYHVADTNFRISDDLINELLDTDRFPNWNSTCGLSKNIDILNYEKLKDARRVCEFHIQEYVKNIMAIKNTVHITTSWLSRNQPNDDHPIHDHPNSVFSGCLYLRSSPRSLMIFEGKNHFSRHWPFCYHYEHPTNIYNANEWPVVVDTGTFLLWPSDVLHRSNRNPLDVTRLALCFNTFVSGDLTEKNINVFGARLTL
jgi:hypothetical protein